jgi:hypothetical protein
VVISRLGLSDSAVAPVVSQSSIKHLYGMRSIGMRTLLSSPFDCVSYPIRVLAFRTGSSLSAARWRNEYFARNLNDPTNKGAVVVGPPKAPMLSPNTIAMAGVRAVVDEPLV